MRSRLMTATLGAVLGASLASGTYYVLRDKEVDRHRRRLMSGAPAKAPGLLIDRAEEPRFYAEPQISRRRRRRLRGKLKALARASSPA